MLLSEYVYQKCPLEDWMRQAGSLGPNACQVPKQGTNRDPSEKQFQALGLLLWLLLSCCGFPVGIFLGNLCLVFCLSLLQEKTCKQEGG